MRKIHNFVLKIMYSPILLVVAAHARKVWVIKLIRAMPASRIKTLIISFMDPNLIRKNTRFTFKEKLITTLSVDEKASYIVNINEHIGYQFFLNGKFDDTIHKVASRIGFCTSNVLLDIGANIGTTSIPLSLKFDSEVIAIEGSLKNTSILLQNLSLNKVKAHVVCAILTDEITCQEKKFMHLWQKNGNSGANSIYQKWNPSLKSEGFEIVPTTTLDKVLSSWELDRIKLIKIDVEGAEEQVLRGFSLIEKIDAPILFEWRYDLMNQVSDLGSNGILGMLEQNFTLYGLKTDADKIELAKFESNQSWENAIGLPTRLLGRYLEFFNQ